MSERGEGCVEALFALAAVTLVVWFLTSAVTDAQRERGEFHRKLCDSELRAARAPADSLRIYEADPFCVRVTSSQVGDPT